MTDEMYQQLLNTKKFETISFVMDYLAQIKDIQGNINLEDHASALSKMYDDVYKYAQNDLLEKYSSQMLSELKESYEK